MKYAKVFQSGNSQAVRLPKEFQFHSKEVQIYRRGKDIILHEQSPNLAEAFRLLTSMPADFFSEARQDTLPQDRDYE